ncbi:peptidoglycan-binding protein [Actinoplanes sp. LDG1-06]|uniref:Peptidoglycan-binding protein n=1 Tax=Paractinoplanes ovalisporus TaxID=2810368 RepID=A0ABS2AGQ9_9ACTN|nr:peptidoglycan-binding protein [Actinoplanes ovalisporus]MBM2619016.1 peptidoglycan-binding protein [Actinoplanes ovalisporus]
MWKRWLITALVLAGLGAGATVLVTRYRAADREPVPRETVAAETAKLERRTLSTVRKLPGSLGFGAARPLEGHTEATVTWLPAVGTTIRRGHQLFRADDKPVTLFYGSMPLYRPIATPKMTGRDVRIIVDNLRALGYRTGSQRSREEGELTPGLIDAIKKWQKDQELPVTGTIAVGDIEVQSGAVRVETIAVQPGSPAKAPLMTVTSTRKVITVAAEPADAAAIQRGAHVTVSLPDDRTAKARVLSVGRELVPSEAGGVSGPPKLTVTVTVDDPATVAKLDSAEVEINFPGRTREGVLTAPIEALVALSEGGYAVQGPGGLVAVETGMFADGWVEITGDGLDEGTEVVVAS